MDLRLFLQHQVKRQPPRNTQPKLCAICSRLANCFSPSVALSTFTSPGTNFPNTWVMFDRSGVPPSILKLYQLRSSICKTTHPYLSRPSSLLRPTPWLSSFLNGPNCLFSNSNFVLCTKNQGGFPLSHLKFT